MDSDQTGTGGGLRLPPTLQNAPHHLAARDGVFVYGAELPACAWQRVRFAPVAIVLMGDNSSGLARWLGPEGKRLSDLSSGDVWIIPPGMETTCEFHGPTNLLMVFLEPRHLSATLPKHARRLSEHCTVAAFDDYAVMAPMLHEMHFVLQQQSRGLPYAASGKDSIDQINCATVFARQLWLLHYVGIRVVSEGISPAEAIQDLDAP